MKCAWIENMISVEPDGWSRPCCGETSVLARISPISNGIINAFNDPKLLKLRSSLENGFSAQTRHACSRCEILENNNQQSLRLNTGFISNTRELKFLQFKLSNKCQLTCAHCGPDLSSGWAKLLNITPHVKTAFDITEEFLNELSEILPQLETIKFTGGEPFLDPTHWKILEHLKQFNRSHCKLQYITNGISPFRPKLWEGWGSVDCSVSVDGFEESYEWFRRGSSWDKVISGIDKLKSFSNVSINYSLTPFTIQDYLVAEKFWNYNISPVYITFPSHASLINFPKIIVERIENYQNISYTAFSDNYNIEEYVRWANKWDKTWNTPGWADKLFWWVKEFNDRNQTVI